MSFWYNHFYMKTLTTLSALIFISTFSYAQVQYTVNKVEYGTINTKGKLIGGMNPLTKRFTVILYSDALVFDDGNNTYYKFARQIESSDRKVWNATDRGGNVCRVTVMDYQTYSLIAIRYDGSNKVTIYQTL